MSKSVLDSPHAWGRLALTLAIAPVANVGMWAIIVVMPAVEAEFGTGRAEASLPYTLTMIGFAVGNFAIGRAVDRWGVTRVLVACGLGIAAGYGLAILSTSILMLSLAQLVVGFFTAVGFGPLIADISHWFIKRRGIAVALVASGNYISGAFWPIILAGYLAEDGWRMVYVILAVATLCVVIPLAFALRRSVPEEAYATAEAASGLRAQSVGLSPRMLAWLLGLAGVGCCVAMSMPQVHIVSYCVDLGYGPAVGAEMLSLMLLGGVASRIVSGALADRLGGVMTLLIGSVLQCIALVLYLPSDALISLYVVALCLG